MLSVLNSAKMAGLDHGNSTGTYLGTEDTGQHVKSRLSASTHG